MTSERRRESAKWLAKNLEPTIDVLSKIRTSVQRRFEVTFSKEQIEEERKKRASQKPKNPSDDSEDHDARGSKDPNEGHWYVHAPSCARVGKTPIDVPPGTFSEPHPGVVIRGPGYLDGSTIVDRTLKVRSETPAYRLVGINVFRKKSEMRHISSRLASLKEYLARRPDKEGELLPRFIVACWTFKSTWTRDHTCVVHLFERDDSILKGVSDDSGFKRSLIKFMQGSDEYRIEHLKFLFQVQHANKSLRSAITAFGGERPTIIAKKLKSYFFKGQNYLEFQHDVGSSTVASMMNGTVLKASKGLVADTMWTIEAKHEDELPERVFAIARWNFVSIADIYVELNEDFTPKTLNAASKKKLQS